MAGAIGNGRYRLGRQLARRETGAVWLGTDAWLDAPVVLKVAPVSASAGLRGEYGLLSRIRHPNVVRTIDLLEEGDQLWLVLERADGPDFLAWVSEDPGPERVALGAAAVARGLQQVHAAGIVHRDISPANIRVGGGELGSLPAAKIIDFGLAAIEPAAETAGTRGYIAPEVLAGGAARPASDLYALGAVVLEALTGWRAGDAAADRAAHEPRAQVLERWPAARLLAEVVADLLHPEADRRPGAVGLLDALGQAVGRDLHVDAAALAGDYDPSWPPLAGRGDCLLRFERVAEEVRSGRCRRVQLVGGGKSRMAEEARRVARLEGLEVHAASDPAMLLRLAGITAARDEAPRLLAVRAADRLLASDRPLMLCLDGLAADDREIADGPGLYGLGARVFVDALVEQLDRRPAARGGLILWTGELPAAADGGRWEQIALPPLGATQVRQLVDAMLACRGAPERRPGWADGIHAASGGDPRRVVELVRGQVAAGLPERLIAPPDLVALTRQRIASLEPSDQRLLGLLALTPRPVPPTVLARVAAAEIGALGGLIARGLITTAVEGIQPDGRVVGEAARALLVERSGEAIGRLHRLFADAWSAHEPIDAATIGHHLLRAGAPEAGAAKLLEAPLAAAEDLRRAADELPASSSLLPSVLERLAHAARAAGDLDRALDVARRLEALDGRRAALLRAELQLDAGQPAAAIEALDGLAATRGGEARVLRARALVLLGSLAEAAEEARAGLAGEGLWPVHRVQLQNVLGLALDSLGRHEEALDQLQRAAASARRLDRPALLARVLNSQGIALSRLGRLDEASACYGECVERFRDLGDLRLAATCTLNLGTLAQRRMALGEALDHYRAAAALGEQGALETSSAWAVANEANLLLLFGEVEKARERLERALRWARAEGSQALVGHLLLFCAEALRAEGRFAEALEEVERARERFDATDLPAHNAADLVACELLLRLGDPPAAAVTCQRLRERMAAGDPERWWALLLAGKVALARTPPAHERAAAELEAALATGAGRPHGAPGERDWEILALLAHCYRELSRPELAEEAGRRFRVALDELRRRVPPTARHRFDARVDVSEALALVAGVERGEAGSSPTSAGLRRVLELNQELNRGLSVEQLLPRLLDAAIELTGAERGFVLLGAGRRLRLAASRNVDRDPIRRGMAKLSRSIAREAIETDRPVVVNDATEDARYQQQLSVRGLKLRAVLCVPMRARGEVLGALYLDNRFSPGLFEPSTVALAGAFADQAGIALDSARLLEQTASQREQLARAKAEVEALNHKLEARLAEQSQQLSEVSTRLRHQEEELVRRYNAARLVGRSKPMRRLFLQIDRVKDSDLPVFVYGESGTGKELVARAIHYNGPRAAEPFVAVNCGALPAELLESELFGYLKGAFTGADQDRPGVFEVAGGGTLFLDEVTEMAPAMQVKLLRVLQEGTFRRLGDQQERQSGCRVLSASNQPLQQAVQRGRFREDLYYRLNVVEIDVPPLRERPGDLPLLTRHFLAESQKELAPPALAALLDHDWPGNVRQLENELSRAALLAGSGTIGLSDLSRELRGAAPASELPATSLQQAVRDYERRVIESALEQAEQNVSLAAEQLQIHRVVLHRKIKAFGIKRKSRAQAS